MTVRDAVRSELARLHEINEAGTPGVGRVSLEQLERLMGMATATLVAEQDGEPAGFILCLTEGADYASRNYRWISERYAAFAYCDRIAVAPEARGSRIGEALYAAAEARLGQSRDQLLCEVNLEPPNPGSLRFHERLGFERIGEAWRDGGSYGVVYLAKRIGRPNESGAG